jgi:hypothetical protein
MANQFDKIAVALSSGLPRRQVLKSVAAAMFAAASGATLGARQSAGGKGADLPASASRQAVMLELLHGKYRSLVTIRDRAAGRVTFPGQPTAALVPHIMDSGVELSIYDAATMTLSRRIPLVFRGTPVPADVAFLPGVKFGVSQRHAVGDPVPDTTDCCASCCWGGSICGCAGQCDSGNPGCGNCCDSGCCPPPPPMD